MKTATILQTFVSRFLILFLNFGLVIFSTNFWGSEGKGVISLLTADLAIILFISNIFIGSSVSYFASKFRTEEILTYAYLWSIIVGIIVPLVIGIFHASDYTSFLIGLCISNALLTSNINFYVGMQNIKMYNLYTILQLLLHIVFIAVLIWGFQLTSVKVYLLAQIGCFALLFLISAYQIFRKLQFSLVGFSGKVRAEIFHYGWKTQLSAFLQFLNNRLSYYFLEFYRGVASVGIYSVGIAVSEAIWTISRSLAIVLYSDVLHAENASDSIIKTKFTMKLSCVLTLLLILVIIAIPADVYTFIFGKDFSQTKKIVLLLSPGILAIAISNVVGFYFSAINKLRILNLKSIIGLLFTIIASLYFVPKFGIIGACLVASVSYCLSSIVLLWQFYQNTPFRFNDFLFSKNEIKMIFEKIKLKTKK